MEGGFARCDSRETCVDRILWSHAGVLQLRDVTRGQVEVKVWIRLGCRGLLTRRRRVGCRRSGLSIQRLNDFVWSGRGKVLVSRIVFARKVKFGKSTGLSPNISVLHTVPISFSKFLKGVNHDLLHLPLAEKLAAGSAPAKSEAAGEACTWIHYSATSEPSACFPSSSCSP